jgi:hypothetical protein
MLIEMKGTLKELYIEVEDLVEIFSCPRRAKKGFPKRHLKSAHRNVVILF